MSIAELIKDFGTLQDSDPCIFILRHAEKPVTKDMYVDMANAITEEGVKSSKKLGNILKSLYPKVSIVRSSPIARCLETASNIFSAYPDKILIIPDTVLGGDGAYVSDNKLAAQHFLEDPSRTDVFIRMQNGEPFEGMREVNTGTQLLLTKIIQDLGNITTPGFYITHDCILALFVGSMIDQVIDERTWFQYLDGICIKKLNNKINLYWKKKGFDITKKLEKLAQEAKRRKVDRFNDCSE
jgi:hypothetical protein